MKGTVLASAADSRYGYELLNMIGSVKANSDLFDRIVVYDLGLDPTQGRLARGIRGVEVREVPPFAPHWAQGRTWKTWIWTHLEAEAVFWLDAGATVLRPLDEVLSAIAERGYFAVSQGHPNRKSTPSDYVELYGLTDAQLDQDAIAAGIFGFATSGPFFEDVIVKTYDDALAGRTLGYSAADAERLNHGLDFVPDPLVRDCPAFRWDQSVLNIRFAQAVTSPRIHDVYKFAGWKTSRDHPEQVIWSHRRRCDYRYLWRVPYTRAVAPRGLAVGIRLRTRWLWREHGWKLKPGRYVARLRRIGRSRRES